LFISASSRALVSCRHSDSKNVVKDDKGFSATDSDMGDVYPLQLRLSVQRETNSCGVRISKKVSLSLGLAFVLFNFFYVVLV